MQVVGAVAGVAVVGWCAKKRSEGMAWSWAWGWHPRVVVGDEAWWAFYHAKYKDGPVSPEKFDMACDRSLDTRVYSVARHDGYVCPSRSPGHFTFRKEKPTDGDAF